MIDIRDKDAAIRASVEITDQCVYSKTLMEEEYVLLSFESDTLINFAKDDYIQTEFGVFSIVKLSRPQQSSNGGYTYTQKFHAGWERWRNHITFYDRQRGSEKSWKMTQTPEYFLDIICRNILNAGYGEYSFVIDASLTEMKLVEFDCTNIIDALTKVAETWDSEWWISGNIIHLAKCEFGTPVSLSENKELGIIESEASSDTDSFTRAYVFGSTRNLPKNYRKDDDTDTLVIDGVVETRLKLPEGVPYIDAWEDMKDEDVVEGVILLEEVYPRKTGTISTITTKKYTDEIENEDGTTTYRDWNAFRFTDSELAALKFSSDYILPNEELRIIFQSGKLAGMEFAVIFNPDGVDESNSDAQLFEIVRNEDYGVALPTDDFKPAVGDTYILYGYDTQFVYDKLVDEAEEELLEKGVKKLADAARDKSVYNCPTNPVRCAGYTEDSNGGLVYAAADEIDLDVGQAVALFSVNHFGEASRASRVRSFEKKLRNRYEATYVIGETSAYSRGDALQEQVQQLTYQTKQFVNVYGSAVYVVGRYDTTTPSDVNVPSFKRAKYEFLQKNIPDRAAEKITFEKGFEAGNYVSGESGAKIDGSGNGELLNLLVRAMISSAKFADGFTGEGWRIWLEEGLSRLTVDKLTVRKAMTVFELLIEKIRAIGGQLYVSAASGKIKSVREEEDGLRYGIAFEQGNEFTSSDLIRCQTFSGGTLKNYWVTVDEVIDDEIFIEKTEFEGQSLPEVGDECVLAGNSYITDRQNLILISATEDGQPRIDILDGVSGKSFEGCLRARLGALSGITDSAFASDKQPSGYGIYSDNVFLRGEFVLSSGEDVATRFEVTEGKITSAVDSLRGDVDVPGNFISNPMFADGMNGWEMFSDTPITVDDTQTTANIIVPTASVVRDSDGRPVCRITQCGISQSRNDMVGEPDEYPTGDDGLKKPVPVYLSFLYKANTSSGRISARLTNSRRTGFVTRYTPLSFEEQTVVGDEYRLVTCSGLWNGAGGLIIEMTGGTADVYMVTLTQDKAGALATKYSTLFEQSDKLVKISASNFDADGNVLEESSIAATAREISLSVKEEIDGELKNTGIDITSGEIELRSDMVRFTDSEGKEQAFITNGKIHANAIDADNITASRLEMYRKDADGNKAARPTVVITPEQKGMAIYKDDTGVTCQEFTGKEYTDEGAAAFFGENSSGTLSVTSAGSKPTLTATEELPSRDRSSKYNISTAIQIAASTTVEITVGKLQAYASAISGSVPADDPSVIVPTVFSSANSTVSLYLRIYAESGCSTLVEEHVVASVSASSVARRDISTTTASEYTYTATPDNQILDCAGKGVRIQSGGYARLEVVYSESVSGYTTSGASTAYIAYGTQVTGGAQIAANYKTDSYISRFFANGFCLGTRTDNYALAQNTASGIGFGVQSGDGAGFKLSKSSGFRQLVNANGNDPWCPIPKLLCRCTYNYVSSSTSYSPAYDGYNFATDYPAPSRTATGKVRITIPSTWTEILGSNVLVAKRLLVSVEGRNTSNVFGAVTGISNGYIYISLQTPSAAADGSFILTIELI